MLNEAKWPEGATIKVGFLGGDVDLQRRVQDVAQEWTGPQMARLQLNFVDGSTADIRIAFEQGNGSWSYLGTEAQQISAADPTMNYGWLRPDSTDDELRRVVLHEFGHALGLIHEHQNPDKPIAWNKAAVIADLSKPPNSWTPEVIENNIFKTYDKSDVDTTATDPASIMMYPIPASWTTDGFSAGLNKDLSTTDKDFVRTAYPW
ncbi:M12 family metallopeptidase [Arthrobacter sp. SLBN-100]|uniref:M12 family metallopeptidase n=1 Tax=Arthrobacter sp. SLBN-100 TaxID=2768450 RepID=UPI001F27F4CD|nr:M12 family metallopeptidase [Arthrobacter sp. SLBN-100]